MEFIFLSLKVSWLFCVLIFILSLLRLGYRLYKSKKKVYMEISWLGNSPLCAESPDPLEVAIEGCLLLLFSFFISLFQFYSTSFCILHLI